MTPALASIKVTMSGLGSTATEVNTFKELEFSLGLGAIFGGVSSILGALSSLAYLLKKVL